MKFDKSSDSHSSGVALLLNGHCCDIDVGSRFEVCILLNAWISQRGGHETSRNLKSLDWDIPSRDTKQPALELRALSTMHSPQMTKNQANMYT